jgi:iron complex transport system substrate-binding protein
VLFVLGASGGAFMAAGSHTSADALIRLAGGRNAIDGYEGYKPLSPEVVAALQPEALIITSRTLQGLGGEQALWQRPELALAPPELRLRLIVLDDLAALGFGPRLADTLEELAQRLHAPSHAHAPAAPP